MKSNKFVTQAVMIGDKRKFPSILIVPNFEQLEAWAKKRNILWTDRSQLLKMPAVQTKDERRSHVGAGRASAFREPEESRSAGARLLDRAWRTHSDEKK